MNNPNIFRKEQGSGRRVRVSAGPLQGMSGHQNACSPADSGVGLDGVFNPPGEAAEVGVDARFVGLATGKVSPGHEALEGTIADHGPPGITLWRRKGGTKRQRCE